MTRLLIVSSAAAALVDGKPLLDIKFVEGMRCYSNLWSGPVYCMLKLQRTPPPFSAVYEPETLPFDLALLPPAETIGPNRIAGADLILSGGDSHEHLHLADLARQGGKKLAYIIEYIPETRRQIIRLDRSRNFPKKVYATLWAARQERRRRRAFRLADGIQANGYPAFAEYGSMNPNTMMYLDNRVSDDLLATEEEMDVRRKRLLNGATLRLMHSGRLEPMKGSHDLVPLARRLEKSDIDFELHIFGSGSLEREIRDGIARYGLEDRVRLGGVVDFETELVPFARTRADIYVSCHLQSDPSCTYIESMGCGLAVAGYGNRMWAALCKESGGGQTAPMGDVNALAEAIVRYAKDRQRLVAHCAASRSFASRHSFEREFQRRVDHLRALV